MNDGLELFPHGRQRLHDAVPALGGEEVLVRFLAQLPQLPVGLLEDIEEQVRRGLDDLEHRDRLLKLLSQPRVNLFGRKTDVLDLVRLRGRPARLRVHR